MQIAPGLHSIRQDEGGHVHAFLIDDGTGFTLIDTPKPSETAEDVYRFEVKLAANGKAELPVMEENVYDQATAVRARGAITPMRSFSETSVCPNCWL